MTLQFHSQVSTQKKQKHRPHEGSYADVQPSAYEAALFTIVPNWKPLQCPRLMNGQFGESLQWLASVIKRGAALKCCRTDLQT